MRIFLLRHAEAVDAETFPGKDLARPLTARGRRAASQVCRALTRLAGVPSLVVSSEALRARQTATVALTCWAKSRPQLVIDGSINPGCRPKDLKKAVDACPSGTECVALVGHEPDLTTALAKWIGGEGARFHFKPGACAVVDLDRETGKAKLVLLVNPEAFAARR